MTQPTWVVWQSNMASSTPMPPESTWNMPAWFSKEEMAIDGLPVALTINLKGMMFPRLWSNFLQKYRCNFPSIQNNHFTQALMYTSSWHAPSHIPFWCSKSLHAVLLEVSLHNCSAHAQKKKKQFPSPLTQTLSNPSATNQLSRHSQCLLDGCLFGSYSFL